MADKPIAAGKSSYSLIKSSQFFSEIGLVENIIMLDLACGVGTYAMAASSHVGSSGKIIAVDLWKDGIDTLRAEIQTRKIRLSPKTLETFLRPFKFLPDKTVDMGDHLYLSIYYKS